MFVVPDCVVVSGESTQKMPPASYPTPAQLDAYAKKIANRPLSIQIFPNTVKVPQRKHLRRTVNGLDTCWPNQRHIPELVSASRGLLAVSNLPAKGVGQRTKELDSSHFRHCHKVAMNPQGGTYRSTLHQPAVHLQSSAQARAELGHKQNLLPPQQQQQQKSLVQTETLHQPGNLADSQTLHSLRLRHSETQQHEQAVMPRDTSQYQRLTHPAGLQQQQQQQRLFHLPTCESRPANHQASFRLQAVHQDLHHVPDEAALLNLRPVDHLLGLPPAQAANGFEQPGPSEQRKHQDGDVPPNVTVSTSTIPLSMASNLHQNHPGDLSSIVHQINQLCQARAGVGATSVCEGQIANPSPISRNLLINCLMVGHSDKASAQASSAPPQPNGPVTVGGDSFQRESEKVQQQQQQIQQYLHRQQLQQQMQQQRSWSRHQLDHEQDLPEGALPCKSRRLEPPTECSFSSQTLNYNKLHQAQRTSAASCQLGSMIGANRPLWTAAPSGHQEHPLGLQAAPVASSVGRTDGPSRTKMVHKVDLFGRPVHLGGFQGPGVDLLESVQQGPVAGAVQTPCNVGVLHTDHQGFC